MNPFPTEGQSSAPVVRRLSLQPIITAHMDDRMGDNINGPSLIKVPDWAPRPLGKYYLYFAHHDGDYIRLAYANNVAGPWTMHREGVLPLAESLYAGHLASPDVIVCHEQREIRLYYHGSETATALGGKQTTRVATSTDGLRFRAKPEQLGGAYFRLFHWDGYWYSLAMPGRVYRSADGVSGFEEGPLLNFPPGMRHSAVLVKNGVLQVFFSSIGDCPERILFSTIDLRPHWHLWVPSWPVTVLAPELEFEGGHLELAPSVLGRAHMPLRQLRDPAIFTEDGRSYLLYATAGESGIGLAEYFYEGGDQ